MPNKWNCSCELDASSQCKIAMYKLNIKGLLLKAAVGLDKLILTFSNTFYQQIVYFLAM